MDNSTISTRTDTDGRLWRKTGEGWIELKIPPLGSSFPKGEPVYDPENPPMSAEQLARMKRRSFARQLRMNLGLSREDFSRRYHIPIETLKSWEHRTSEPDAPAVALLKLIAADPDGAAEALRGEELGVAAAVPA